MLNAAKAEIREVDPHEVAARLDHFTLLDVREPDEYEQGALPGAIHVPRGQLEFSIEGRLGDKGAPIAVYCAGGTRSAFAAKTLQDLGYRDVVSVIGGFNRWKDEGLEWSTPHTMTQDQRIRYHRHLLLPEVGEEGQMKLLNAKVLVLGAGGLGSPALIYLAAAGVGTLGVVDMDVVDASNLQRQILHTVDRIGMRKVDSAKAALTAMNPDVEVITHHTRLGADNILDIIDGYDIIVDGTDNFTVFSPYVGPCYRCMIPEPPPAELAPSCAEAGVLGVLPGIIGSIQAVEAIKLILGLGEPLIGRLLTYDSLDETFRTFKVRLDPSCPACGENAGPIQIAEYDDLCMPHPVNA